MVCDATQDSSCPRHSYLFQYSFWGVIYSFFFNPKQTLLFYFEEGSKWEHFLGELFIKMMGCTAVQVKEEFGSEGAETLGTHPRTINNKITDFAHEVAHRDFDNSAFSKVFLSLFGNEEKARILFNKYLDVSIRRLLIAVVMTERLGKSDEGFIPVLLVPGVRWAEAVGAFAENYSVNVVKVPFSGKGALGAGFCSVLLIQVLSFLKLLFKEMKGQGIEEHVHDLASVVFLNSRVNSSHLRESDLLYWAKGLSFDNMRVIIPRYGGSALSSDFLEEVKSKYHLEIYDDREKRWRLGRGYYRTVFSLLFRYAFLCIGNWHGLHRETAYFRRITAFIPEFSYWLDFFSRNESCCLVSDFNFNFEHIFAMDKLEGVTVSYQQSISMRLAPQVVHSNGTDVQFCNSKYYCDIFGKYSHPGMSYIITGHQLPFLGNEQVVREKLSQLKDKFNSAGVQKTFCFFDENPIGKWWCHYTVDDLRTIYKRLFRFIIENERYAMLLKPKSEARTEAVLDAIGELRDKAYVTGRCVMLCQEEYGMVRPSMCAEYVDLCIGETIGGTAACESYLAGCPAVLLDSGNERFFEAADPQMEKITFSSVENLIEVLQREERFPSLGFGDWRCWNEIIGLLPNTDFDRPFEVYFTALFEALESGVRKDNAIEYANRTYALRYGSEWCLPAESLSR